MKRLVICSDGTWNKPGNRENGFLVRTNVQKIFEVIDKTDGHIPQIKHYDTGVGTAGSSVARAINGALGSGLESNIINAYKFIIWNYEPGDEIYMFGFSRGAYTVRSLAGLIRKSGILRSQDLCLVDEAFQLYREKQPDRQARRIKSEEFIKAYSYPDPRIKFLGVWDTVGALGIPHTAFRLINKKKYRFHDLTLSSIIEHACQAMAIDERRGLFDVNIWKRSQHAIENDIKQFVEQRWFAGVHCEVGGGYHEEQLSDLPLLWMIDRAHQAGLKIDLSLAMKTKDFPEFLAPDLTAKLHDSLTFIHRFNPVIMRKIGQASGFNECIDASVMERMHRVEHYSPKNVEHAVDRGIEVRETVTRPGSEAVGQEKAIFQQ